jgi:hypothetical protein
VNNVNNFPFLGKHWTAMSPVSRKGYILFLSGACASMQTAIYFSIRWTPQSAFFTSARGLSKKSSQRTSRRSTFLSTERFWLLIFESCDSVPGFYEFCSSCSSKFYEAYPFGPSYRAVNAPPLCQIRVLIRPEYNGTKRSAFSPYSTHLHGLSKVYKPALR